MGQDQSSRGAADGWNDSNPGYVNNTREGAGKSGDDDPDWRVSYTHRVTQQSLTQRLQALQCSPAS